MLATAHRLVERLPASLGLSRSPRPSTRAPCARPSAAASACARARTSFFDTVGGAVPDVLAAMERHQFALDRPKLMAALRSQAAVRAD